MNGYDFFSSIYDYLPLKACNFLRAKNVPCQSTSCHDSKARVFCEDSFQSLLKNYRNLFLIDMHLAIRSFPVIASIVHNRLSQIHYRSILPLDNRDYYRYSCFPGYDKLFCDVSGNYYPCERTELNDSFYLGNVFTGLDTTRVIAILERLRNIGKCGLCKARSFCEICFAHIHINENNDWDLQALDNTCRKFEVDGLQNIKDYVSLMEIDRSKIDLLLKRDEREEQYRYL